MGAPKGLLHSSHLGEQRAVHLGLSGCRKGSVRAKENAVVGFTVHITRSLVSVAVPRWGGLLVNLGRSGTPLFALCEVMCSVSYRPPSGEKASGVFPEH